MRTVCLALLALLALGASSASTAASKPAGQCFFTRDWRGWKAIDDKGIYIRVGVSQLYRIDFSARCPGLTSPGAHLITQSVTGSVCTPLDLDVKVSDQSGFSTACIVSRITPLSGVESAALPKKLIP